MSIDTRFTSIKSAGVYRFESDRSQIANIPSDQLRLMVGFSKVGPFNTPVFVPDSNFFKSVFGEIDRTLERKDSYFHRSCLTALERGPILALNLLSLDEEDLVDYIELSTSVTPTSIQNNEGQTGEYRKFYNRDKFFTPSTENFLNVVGANRTQLSFTSNNNLLNFVNLSQKPISIIVKKALNENVSNFNVTAEEWYGSANVPGFLNKNSLISDFMVDIFVISGNFGGDFSLSSPYERFIGDPVFQEYFSKTRGIKRKTFQGDSNDTKLQEFFNESEVNLIASYTACLIPNFVDLIGNNLYVENVVNRDSASTGLYCSVNEDLFSGDFLIDGVPGGIDLIGHNLEYQQQNSSQSNINFLSYNGPIVQDLSYARNSITTPTSYTTVSADSGSLSTSSDNFVITIDPETSLYDEVADFVANGENTVGTYIKGEDADDSNKPFYAPVTNITNNSDGTISFTISRMLNGTESGIATEDIPIVNDLNDNSNILSAGIDLEYLNLFGSGEFVHEWDGSTRQTDIIGTYGTNLYSDFSNGTLTDGDKAVFETGGDEYTSYLTFNTIDYEYIGEIQISHENYYIPSVRITPYQENSFDNLTPSIEFDLNSGNFLTSDESNGASQNLVIQTLEGSNNVTLDIISDSTTDSDLLPNQVLVSSNFSRISEIIEGNYLVSNIGSSSSRLTRIVRINGGQTNSTYSSIPAEETAVLITCQEHINVNDISGTQTVEMYYPIDSWVDYLNIFTLNGFELKSKHIPDGTNAKQNSIFNNTLNGTNLYKSLTDRETISFRYVVDTFGNGIEPSSKSIYTKLCRDRKSSFAIINAPSAKNFRDSTDPIFTDINDSLSSKFISDGGNKSLNPSFRFTLPSKNSGGSWGSYFYPFVTVRDINRNINVPPAAMVSNNFVNKFENALPWSVVAGVRRGVLSSTGLVGLEINLDKEDRDFLEPFGINPIVFQSGVGPTIFANKTAQQNPLSALSSINVREVSIEIQNRVEEILKLYIFETNTEQIRLEIRTQIDNLLSQIQDDNGIYDYRVVMDESNNTSDVLDRNLGVVDLYIEPVRSMDALVQRITILKTNAISSGNFQ